MVLGARLDAVVAPEILLEVVVGELAGNLELSRAKDAAADEYEGLEEQGGEGWSKEGRGGGGWRSREYKGWRSREEQGGGGGGSEAAPRG